MAFIFDMISISVKLELKVGLVLLCQPKMNCEVHSDFIIKFLGNIIYIQYTKRVDCNSIDISRSEMLNCFNQIVISMNIMDR